MQCKFQESESCFAKLLSIEPGMDVLSNSTTAITQILPETMAINSAVLPTVADFAPDRTTATASEYDYLLSKPDFQRPAQVQSDWFSNSIDLMVY
jgi:hypothetical protein